MFNTDMMDIKSHMLKYNGLILVCFSLFLSGCTSWKTPASAVDDGPVIFPDYKDVTVPCNIAPLNFMIEGAERIQAMICMDGHEVIRVSGKDGILRIPLKKWRSLMDQTAGSFLEVQVSAWTDEYPEGVAYKPFKVHVATDEIDPWISYRLIEPGYEGWSQVGIFQRDMSSFDEEAIVTNHPSVSTCINCHTYPSYSAESMMFHARGPKGGTVIYRDGKLEKIDFKNIGPKMNVTYPAWHPEGRYLAFSSTTTYLGCYDQGRQPVEVYDIVSDLLVYDIESGEVLTDSRFLTEDPVETFPTWSPDGGYLYYSSSPKHNLPDEADMMKYSIYKVSFDKSSGKFGDDIQVVYDCDADGGSATFPRISPDGRYLLYTLSEFGTFPIWHTVADLKMIDLNTGQPVDVSVWNDAMEADGYHSWSSNGRWVIFGTRRLDGRYTRLFIAHLDAEGKPHKPFLLPQETPLHNTWRLRSYNLPEFTSAKVSLPKEVEDLIFPEE